MSTNSHHASYKGKDYARKDFNYGSNRREFLSENALESQNTNFSSNPTRNSPLVSMNQKDLTRDSFEENSPSNVPLKVKHLQNKQEEIVMPPQPIINDKTLLALDYLQKYLLRNRAVQTINLPEKDSQDQELLHLNDSKNINGDFAYQNNKIIEGEFNKRPKESSEKYERSRSRSNEKKGSYDRRERKDYQHSDLDERYRTNRSSYKNNLEENILEQNRKAAEDWECGNCGNVNWVKQRNCKKCGQKQSLNKNPSSPDGGEFHSYHKGGESLIKRNDYRNNKNFNSSSGK
jgi:hypothetical protein